MKQLLVFHARYCGKCHALLKRLKRLEEEKTYQFSYQVIDTETEKEQTEKWHVTSVPTVIVLENTREITRLKGSLYREDLVDILSKETV